MANIKNINLKKITTSNYPLVIGYFGCIHKMHEKLLTKTKKFNVLTFTDLPFKSKQQLYSFEQRLKLINEYKPKNIFVFDITKNNLCGLDFVNKVLLKIKPTSIIVGSDFRFGNDHRDIKLLSKFFKVNQIKYNNQISTTKISKLLMNESVDKANTMLPKPFFYVSEWIGGKHNGEKLGFPTLNQSITYPLNISYGSYVTKIQIDNKTFKSVSFYGASKISGRKKPTLETHIINQKINSISKYSKQIRNNIKIEFLKFIRPNTTFRKIDDLVASIKKDLKFAIHYFSNN